MYGTSNLPRVQIHENLTVLLAVAAGKGSLEIDNLTYELTEGSVVLLPANTHASLITNLQQPLHVYKLTIWIQEQTQTIPGGAMIRKSEFASSLNILLFPYEPIIVSNVKTLYLHRLPDRETRHAQNQILFHQIILQLLEQIRIVLASAAVSAFLYAIVSGVSIAFKISKDASMWTAGGLICTTWGQLQAIVPVIVIGIVVAFIFSNQLTILSLSDEVARIRTKPCFG